MLAALSAQEGGDGRFASEKLAELEGRAGEIQARLEEIREIFEIDGPVDPAEVERVLALFDPAWDELTLDERCRAIRLLVEGVEFDGVGGEIQIAYCPLGKSLLNGEALEAAG